ncbi:glycosyltransferase [Hymenobacter sp. 5516J-16]|uniref:glycosyltransferase n=1 Tax=Hymenobacter sp. 5516J-16 TaxID=2932253 RepID=UPI001FD2337F|nr:glycosyltransferase [Hymenobacter sp. 5516J-16]UOQ76171.1 glycosyltransferase [Hymenobacter sp. 5516J-16]
MDTSSKLKLMNQPLVTVGVASYNNAAYLRETLESIRQQTYPNVEVLIVDDASTDESVAVARAWLAEHPQVRGRVIEHPVNRGICPACNTLVTQAQGEFICLIGSDDVYLPDKLAVQVPLLLNAPPEVGVIFGPVELMGPTGEPLPAPAEWDTYAEGDIFLPLLKQNFIPAMGTLIRRSCYDKVGLYDEELAYEDLDMWLRIARHFKFKYSPRVSARYRVHRKSAMQMRQAVLTESTLRLLHKHTGISAETDAIIEGHTKYLAERLYQWGGKQARRWLKLRWKQDHKLNSGVLYGLASVGIPGKYVQQFQRWLGR